MNGQGFMSKYQNRMNRLIRITISIVSFSILISTALSAQTKYTNQTVDMRVGPAGYYEMLLRLYLNNQVRVDSSQGYWNKVEYENQLGWVPSYSLVSEAVNSDALKREETSNRMSVLFSQLGGTSSEDAKELSASPAQVAAAVKGFAEKYRVDKNIENKVDFARFQIPPFSIREFRRFRRARIDVQKLSNRRRLLSKSTPNYGYNDPSMDRVGYAVATVLAQEGIVENYEAQKYIDMLLALIVDYSHRPELKVNGYILDSDKVSGYALPGNYIFISKEAIKTMKSESELVHFLAHEVAHIIFGHGVQEYEKRRVKIKAADALDELDEIFKDSENTNTELEDELNTLADELYDYVNKERLEEYELEADYWGIVYTYLVGRDQFQMLNFLQEIDQPNNEERAQEWSGIPIAKRRSIAIETLNGLQLRSGEINTNDFDRIKASIR